MSGGFSAAELQAEIPRLRRYARALTGSREAADDLTQDTLEHAWRKRAAYQPHGSLRAWLFTVMHHRFVNGLRTPTHAPHAPVDAAADDTAAPSADGAAEHRVVVGELQAALLALPADQRETVLLVGLEQLSYAEAAAVLGVPIGTVMSRLSRGREALRRALERGAEPRRAPLTRVK